METLLSGRIPVCDWLSAAYAVADWAEPRALFAQCGGILSARPSRLVPDDLRDALAVSLSFLAASYQGREGLLVEHAFAVFAEAEGREWLDYDLFRRFYGARRRARRAGRRPTIFEALVETARRLRELNGLRGLLSGAGTSGVPCGSVSHGPFYNVRGPGVESAASDLDLLVVVGDLDRLPAVVERIAGLPGIDVGSVQRLRARAGLFCDRFDDGLSVFSHKVTMWADQLDPVLSGSGLGARYQVSLHFLSARVLSYALVGSSTTLSRASAGRVRTVLDYREVGIIGPDRQRTFAGREYRAGSRFELVELGCRRPVTVYRFDDADCYCPGLLQTMLFPRFDPLWDDLELRLSLRAFERKYLDRFRRERARSRYGLLLPSLPHVRREEFAPHVVAEFDRSGR